MNQKVVYKYYKKLIKIKVIILKYCTIWLVVTFNYKITSIVKILSKCILNKVYKINKLIEELRF